MQSFAYAIQKLSYQLYRLRGAFALCVATMIAIQAKCKVRNKKKAFTGSRGICRVSDFLQMSVSRNQERFW
jgi:hypothetical protein